MCAYLDVEIKSDNNIITTTIYDKTRDFNFKVIKLFHNSSNVSSNLIESVVYAQLLRFARICSDTKGFITNAKMLYKAFRTNDYDKRLSLKIIKRFIHNNCEASIKLGINYTTLARCLL